uniref:Triabin n=1 Tax=Triatoma dimidiata TaxID=72491 RepID=D1MWF4_TRIDM|nr:hypothetical protein Td153 similar to pallidipin-like salivary lipocalin [Triatoma dimidiata]
MKTLFALTFIGILTYAFAEEPSNDKKCGYKPMENFDSTRYLQITTPLHTTQAKHISNYSVCREFRSIQKSGDKVNINIHGYYKDGGKIFNYELLCSTTWESFNKGQYLSDCKILMDTHDKDPMTSKSFEEHMSVIDTDYDSYAILYTCFWDGVEDIDENVVELEKNPGASNEAITTALKNNEMDLKEFFPWNYNYCQNKAYRYIF